MEETILLGRYISGEKPTALFFEDFKGRVSEGFNPEIHLTRIGVVNQTTMLASDTQAIADYIKQIMIQKYQLDESQVEEHFADTNDTLCYATNDNQSAVYGLLETPADIAIVVGGYNSSNTSHLVALCEEKLPTYFINSEEKIISKKEILHFNYNAKKEVTTMDFLPEKQPVRIHITSGASCPDALVEGVIIKLASLFYEENKLSELENSFRPH
jgi:4-hydroxy-3-methylbut-2-enyl diphosphate reductase